MVYLMVLLRISVLTEYLHQKNTAYLSIKRKTWSLV